VLAHFVCTITETTCMRIQTRMRSLGFSCAGYVKPEDSCGAAALRCAARYVVSLQNWPCSLFKPHNESCSRKSMMCLQRYVYRHMLIDAYAYTHTQSSQHLRRQHICIQLLCINARTSQHMCESAVRVYQWRDTVSCAIIPASRLLAAPWICAAGVPTSETLHLVCICAYNN